MGNWWMKSILVAAISSTDRSTRYLTVLGINRSRRTIGTSLP